MSGWLCTRGWLLLVVGTTGVKGGCGLGICGADSPRASEAAAGMRHCPAGGPWLMPAARMGVTGGSSGERPLACAAAGLARSAGSTFGTGATAASAATVTGVLAPAGATSPAELLARTMAGLPGSGAATRGCVFVGLMAGGELAARSPSARDAMASTLQKRFKAKSSAANAPSSVSTAKQLESIRQLKAQQAPPAGPCDIWSAVWLPLSGRTH
jgi:hypothetical protein